MSWDWKLISYCVGIILMLFLIVWVNRKPKAKKTTRKKSSNKTTATPPNPQSTPKKSTDWWKTLKNVLVAILLLFLVILAIEGIVWLYQKITEPKPKTQNEIKVSLVKQDDYYLKKEGYIEVVWDKNFYYLYKDYGKKYYRQTFYRDGRISGKILQGGDIPKKYRGDVKKERLYFFEKEGMISVFHSEDKKELEKIPD